MERRLVMKFKTLMIIKAVVCLCLGLPILFLPEFTYSLFGTSLNPGGIFAAREYGASLIGNLMVTWFARNTLDSEARRAIILGLFIYDAIGVIVTLLAQFTGILGPLGWFAVLIYLFFTIGFGFFYFKKPK
jgi:hypothetical protein